MTVSGSVNLEWVGLLLTIRFHLECSPKDSLVGMQVGRGITQYWCFASQGTLQNRHPSIHERLPPLRVEPQRVLFSRKGFFLGPGHFDRGSEENLSMWYLIGLKTVCCFPKVRRGRLNHGAQHG